MGSLKLTFSYYGGLATQTVSYNLYTEASYNTSYALMSDMMGRTSDKNANTYEVTIDSLNPGNYYVTASIVTPQNRRLVQVTAGQERSYTF